MTISNAKLIYIRIFHSDIFNFQLSIFNLVKYYGFIFVSEDFSLNMFLHSS